MSFQLPKMSKEDEKEFEYLASVVYPSASLEAIYNVQMSFKQLGMSPRPGVFHIVPMWDRAAKASIDRVMPGINFLRIQASRSGCSGISEPEYGPAITKKYGSRELTHPEWCRVIVKKLLPNGQEATFSNLEYWTECFSSSKDGTPTEIWCKRPYAMLAKTTEAGALRKGFPEVASDYTAEEMEGKELFSNQGEGRAMAAPVASAETEEDLMPKPKKPAAPKPEPKPEPEPVKQPEPEPVKQPEPEPEPVEEEQSDITHPEIADDQPLLKDQLTFARNNFVPIWAKPSEADPEFPGRYMDCKQVHFRVLLALFDKGLTTTEQLMS